MSENRGFLENFEEIVPNFNIDDERREALCFRENLLIFQKDPREEKPVGGYSISIEKIGPFGLEFLVNVVSSMKIEGLFGGSKTIGSLSEKIHCLEEKRNEFLHTGERRQEKMLFIGAEDDFYHLETTRIFGLEKETQERDLQFRCLKNLLSESGHFLLIRYLALTNFHGTLQFQILTIDGKIATCHFKCSAAERSEFNNVHLEIYKIERKIDLENDSVQNIVTYLTKNGQILKHDCCETSYVIKINPLINLDCEKISEKIPLNNCWQEDLELVSKFLDQKTCKMAQKAEYLANYPELKNIIADYVQALLFVKPLDVLTFTIQHFLAFATEPKSMENFSKFDNIETEICQIFKNLEEKLQNSSSEPESISTKSPASSICSSGENCTQIHTILSGKCTFLESTCSLCSEFSDSICEKSEKESDQISQNLMKNATF